ncbi:hypothetical protein PPERSA_02533 [Pseudocohnilembus persalinus]|uniref:Uncharacterized protein n=1 Tax=Pseudocohnilembus persalinus TaxID=266149 RepID=A0A0V0R584_PSEPJ|nr:hypothetical protein PPERSA_02533 [Pseudocohnilembus persalinus]|eukprot:KRX09661.1 hypothetical protein PPERSA_02533 [Pseudocohnilembus persalinus]
MSQVSQKDLNTIKAKQSQQRYLSIKELDNLEQISTTHKLGSLHSNNENNQQYEDETKSYLQKKIPDYMQTWEQKQRKKLGGRNYSMPQNFEIKKQLQQQNQNQNSNTNRESSFLQQYNKQFQDEFQANLQNLNNEKFADNFYRFSQTQYKENQGQNQGIYSQTQQDFYNNNILSSKKNGQYQQKQQNEVIEEIKYDSSPERIDNKNDSIINKCSPNKEDFKLSLKKNDDEEEQNKLQQFQQNQQDQQNLKNQQYLQQHVQENGKNLNKKLVEKKSRKKFSNQKIQQQFNVSASSSTEKLNRILDKQNNLFVSKYRLPKVLVQQRHPLNLLGEQEFFLLPDNQSAFKNYKFKRPIFKGSELEFLMNIPFDEYPKVIVEKNQDFQKYELDQNAIEKIKAKNIDRLSKEECFLYQQNQNQNKKQNQNQQEQQGQNLDEIVKNRLVQINQIQEIQGAEKKLTVLEKMGLKKQSGNLKQKIDDNLINDSFQSINQDNKMILHKLEEQSQIENNQILDQFEKADILFEQNQNDTNTFKNLQKQGDFSQKKFRSIQNFYLSSKDMDEAKKVNNKKLKEKAINLQLEKMKGQLVEQRLQKLDKKSKNLILGKQKDKNENFEKQSQKIQFILQCDGVKDVKQQQLFKQQQNQFIDDQESQKEKEFRNLNQKKQNILKIENFYQNLAKLDKIEEQQESNQYYKNRFKQQLSQNELEKMDYIKNDDFDENENKNFQRKFLSSWQTPLEKYKDYQKWSNIKREQIFSNNLKRYKFNPVKRTQLTEKERKIILESNRPNFLIFNNANILKL